MNTLPEGHENLLSLADKHFTATATMDEDYDDINVTIKGKVVVKFPEDPTVYLLNDAVSIHPEDDLLTEEYPHCIHLCSGTLSNLKARGIDNFTIID